MARLARVILPGIAHHVTQRGVRGMAVFRDDEDRRLYLTFLREESQRHGLRFLAWCLMSNHVHLVVVPAEEHSLARAIGEAHRRYTWRINRREGARGYLFQGRFFSCPLDEPHGLAAVRYVERNPVRAGLVQQAWDYPWSSAAFDAGARNDDALLTEGDREGTPGQWRRWLASDPLQGAAVRRFTCTGRPLGSPRFLRIAMRLTGRDLVPRPPGRPRKTKKR